MNHSPSLPGNHVLPPCRVGKGTDAHAPFHQGAYDVAANEAGGAGDQDLSLGRSQVLASLS